MTDPSSFGICEHEDWSEKRQLQISCDRPSPEEAPIVRGLEIWVKVTKHQKLCPPGVLTVIVHLISCKPNRPSAHVGKDCPSAKENEIVHWSKSEVLARPKFEYIGDLEVTLGFIEEE